MPFPPQPKTYEAATTGSVRSTCLNIIVFSSPLMPCELVHCPSLAAVHGRASHGRSRPADKLGVHATASCALLPRQEHNMDRGNKRPHPYSLAVRTAGA